MDIYLMRHFKVNFELKKKYTSREFRIACDNYDNSDIVEQKIEFDSNHVQQIYISDLMRSNLTFKSLNIDLKAKKTNLINEVPISPFIKTKFKLPTSIWMIFGRIQWFLNIKIQPEIRRETLVKINILISQLEKERKNTLIIGHGFYFSQLKRVLKKMNYSGSGKSFYKNGEIIKFNKS